MLEIVKTILESPAGSFAFVFALMVGAGFMIFWVTRMLTQFEMKAGKIDKLEDSIDDIKEDLHFIKATLNILQSRDNSLTQAHSPVSLTAAGKEVAERMGVRSMIVSNWDKIFESIESEHLKNAYDIQQYCIETATIKLEEFFTSKDIDKIKNFAYNEGKQVAYYGSMIGVIIRDKYFEVKGINTDEVDASDPTK